MSENSTQNNIVCPESTLESAIHKDSRRREISAPREQVCESTIESANRRNFVRRAAAVAAFGAVGIVGATSLDKIIPSSDAKSAACGGSLLLGSSNSACNTTQLISSYKSCLNYGSFTAFNHGTSGRAMVGYATCGSGIGVAGVAGTSLACYASDGTSGTGVEGTSKSGCGVVGKSYSGTGVRGLSYGSGSGVCGENLGCGYGVLGAGKIGVYGLASCLHPCSVAGVFQGKVGINTCSPSKDLQVVGCSYFDGLVGIGTPSSNFNLEVVGSSYLDGPVGIGTSPSSLYGLSVKSSSCVGIKVCSSSALGYGIYLCAASTGIKATSTGTGTAVCALSVSGVGLRAETETGPAAAVFTGSVGINTCTPSTPLDVVGSSPLVGTIKSSASSGDRSALIQFQNHDCTAIDWNIGVAGKCNAHVTDGDFFVMKSTSSTAALSINKCGHVGINGATNPGTNFRVCGSIAAKVVSPTGSTYTMATSDFAVLAGTASMTVTLPAADNATGQIVFIKNISSGSVTVEAKSTDHIEAGTSMSLASTYASVQLMSNGKASPNGVWYIIATGT